MIRTPSTSVAKRPRGLSLVEGVITLFLFAVVLSSVGSLLTDSSRLLRRADELSWTNQASDWVNRMELDISSAYSVALTPGASATNLSVDIRDLDSPDFLPASPSGSWSIDAPNLRLTVVYSITANQLSRAVTPAVGAPSVAVLGEADSLQVERLSNGNFRLTLKKGKEEFRREVPALCVDSLAAPL